MLRDFPSLRRWEDTDSVISGTMLRLDKAMRAIPIDSQASFFQLANKHIHHELLDLLRQHRKLIERYQTPAVDSEGGLTMPGGEPSLSDGLDRCEWWERFHQEVENLPDRTRQVFDLIWYQDMPQVQIAEVMKMDVRSIRRHWIQARQHLIDAGCVPPS